MTIQALEKSSFRRITTAPRRPVLPQTSGGVAVTLQNLHKSFDHTEVLKGIDLHIPAGQFIAVIGKSGCGKSTLLRLIAGLDTSTKGEISIGSGGETASRIVFQEPRLLPWAKVIDNVKLGLTGTPVRDPDQVLDLSLVTLDEVGLENKRDEWPSALSGGQKQRVALARALVSHPRLLALDEPLGALDALTRIDMQNLLEEVWLHQGFTAILVTHDVSEAVALADRVVLIDEGQIKLDIEIDVPRPRRRGSAILAEIEGKVLDVLFEQDPEKQAG